MSITWWMSEMLAELYFPGLQRGFRCFSESLSSPRGRQGFPQLCVSVPRMLCSPATSSLQRWWGSRSPGSSGSCQGLCWNGAAAAGSPAVPVPLGPWWERHRLGQCCPPVASHTLWGAREWTHISTCVSGDWANQWIDISQFKQSLPYLIVFLLKRVSRQSRFCNLPSFAYIHPEVNRGMCKHQSPRGHQLWTQILG